MIRSMTAFAKKAIEVDSILLRIELRSVNSKQLDLSLKIHHDFKHLELAFRNFLINNVLRGKLECILQVDKNSLNDTNLSLNKPQIDTYLKEFKQQYNTELSIRDIITMPNIVIDRDIKSDLAEEHKIALLDLLKDVFLEYDANRQEEGKVLKQDFLNRIDLIEKFSVDLQAYEEERISILRTRILKQLSNLASVEIDNNRLEQEMIYYLEKLDITEEKIRLKQHCKYFKECVDEDAGGKKLGFIVQEIGREINTLGSKANEVNIQKLVVMMKDELEKIKEQLFNIL